MTNSSTKEQVLENLKDLISSKGYIYALCMILFEDFHHDLDKIHLVNYREKLSVKECSLIIGFLIQNEIDFTTPDSPEKVIELKERTYEVMHELQMSLNSPQTETFKELLEKHNKGEDISNLFNDEPRLFAKNGGMVEPMFYAGDGIYDFQYLEYLEKKYKYDKEWLLKNKNFDLKESSILVNKVKAILHEKSKKVNLFDLKETFPKIAEKESKKLKKHHSQKEIEEITRQQYVGASFYQYHNLFKKDFDKMEADKEDWDFFYKNLLDLFIVRNEDFSEHDSFTNFITNFSFSPSNNVNKDYNGPGYFNVLNSRPFIKIDSSSYFVPINFLVAEAVYESPFYWMYDDKDYINKISEHRGNVGEEISFELLSKVFGEENTFKSVLVTTKKGEPDTDIDVLCVLGNKAICVQVKSKKITMNAKRGVFEQLKKDFKGAVQDAYDQGLVSRERILGKGAKFTDKNGNEIHLNKEINEVYIMGLTTENHPSLVHQVRTLLSKEKAAPFPLVLSVFDLELLVHYLPDPYDFLYYVRQRIALMDYFFADEELAFLGYHLKYKLWKDDKYSGGIIDTDFGAIIDRNYYPFKTGLSHLLSDKNDPILNRWKDPKFDHLAKIIKGSNHSNSVDIIFNLLDWSGETRKDLVDHMIKIKRDSIKENSDKSIATTTAPEFGFSYQVFKNIDLNNLEDKVQAYSILKKYQQKCDSWLGLGSFAKSRNLVDFLIYLDEPWSFDHELDQDCKDFFVHAKGKAIKLNPTLSISRNDQCPCKSGLKYKRCCGVGHRG